MRKLVYIAVGGILGIALSGGAAVAGGLIHGKDLAKGTITSRELGAKSVTGAKLSKSLKKQLGKSGSAGPAGPAGPAGATGARGPAGGFNFVDQNGTVVGESVGFYSGVYPMVRLGDGTILTYDNDPANSNAVPLISVDLLLAGGLRGHRLRVHRRGSPVPDGDHHGQPGHPRLPDLQAGPRHSAELHRGVGEERRRLLGEHDGRHQGVRRDRGREGAVGGEAVRPEGRGLSESATQHGPGGRARDPGPTLAP